MRHASRRLSLGTETVRVLTSPEAAEVRGGTSGIVCTITCAFPVSVCPSVVCSLTCDIPTNCPFAC